MSDPKSATRDLVVNRRALHEYLIEARWEAGIALLGSEVKSLRAGLANLQEGWVRLTPEGAQLEGLHISAYEQANRQNHEPVRSRRLLLNASELQKLSKGVKEKGFTIIPLRIYLKGARVKVEIGLAKGKKLHDKRHAIKARDVRRDIDRGDG